MRFTIELNDKVIDESDNIFEARHIFYGQLKRYCYEQGKMGIFDNRDDIWLELEDIWKWNKAE